MSETWNCPNCGTPHTVSRWKHLPDKPARLVDPTSSRYRTDCSKCHHEFEGSQYEIIAPHRGPRILDSEARRVNAEQQRRGPAR